EPHYLFSKEAVMKIPCCLHISGREFLRVRVNLKRAHPKGYALKALKSKELFGSLVNSHSAGNGSANHGVVAHAQQAHHFHVCGHRGRACELSVAVHTAHGVGQAIGSRASSHVVGVQGTAGAAAGSNGEVLLAVLQSPLLVGACNQVLEAGGVGGVTGDGNVNTLVLHDGNAFQNVVSAVALNSSALAVGESLGLDNLQLA